MLTLDIESAAGDVGVQKRNLKQNVFKYTPSKNSLQTVTQHMQLNGGTLSRPPLLSDELSDVKTEGSGKKLAAITITARRGSLPLNKSLAPDVTRNHHQL